MYVDTGGCFSATRIKEFHRGFAHRRRRQRGGGATPNLTSISSPSSAHDVMELFKVLEELGSGWRATRIPETADSRAARAADVASRWVCSSSTVSPPCFSRADPHAPPGIYRDGVCRSAASIPRPGA